MESSFFALLSRMKYIGRWGLMRSAIPENVQGHSHEVAVFAHALGVIRRDVLGQPCDVNALATQALYHDASEIFTGDLPTPIKYHNREITQAYHEVERLADLAEGALDAEALHLVGGFADARRIDKTEQHAVDDAGLLDGVARGARNVGNDCAV